MIATTTIHEMASTSVVTTARTPDHLQLGVEQPSLADMVEIVDECQGAQQGRLVCNHALMLGAAERLGRSTLRTVVPALVLVTTAACGSSSDSRKRVPVTTTSIVTSSTAPHSTTSAPSTTTKATLTTGAAGALSTSSVLSAAGLGPLKLYMTVDEAQKSTDTRLQYLPPNLGSGPLCPRIEVPIADVDVIMDSSPPERIEEIGVRNPAIKTDKGLHVGSTAGEVLASYPAAQRLNSHYSEALAVQADDSALVFRFSVGSGEGVADTAEVTEMSATRADILRAEELCS